RPLRYRNRPWLQSLPPASQWIQRLKCSGHRQQEQYLRTSNMVTLCSIEFQKIAERYQLIEPPHFNKVTSCNQHFTSLPFFWYWGVVVDNLSSGTDQDFFLVSAGDLTKSSS